MTRNLENNLFMTNPVYVRSQGFTYLEKRPSGQGTSRRWMRRLTGAYVILVLIGAVLGTDLWVPTQVQLAQQAPVAAATR